MLAVDLDSQRDLTRSLLKANLLEQAAATGGPPIGIDEHLARPITAAEVEAYNIAQGPDHAVVGVANLTRTLIGGLEPMMGDNPLVKHVVSTLLFRRWDGWPLVQVRCMHDDRHPDVRPEPVVD